MLAKTLVAVQAATGLAFASFVTLHLGNLVAVHLGLDTARDITLALRHIYQNGVVEVGLLGAAASHMMASAALYVLRSQRHARAVKSKGSSDASSSASSPDASSSASSSESPATKGRAYAPPLLSLSSLHKYSGYVLAAIFGAHVMAVRILPLYLMDDPADMSLSIVAVLASKYPGWVQASLAAFGVSAVVHTVVGIPLALRNLGMPLRAVPLSSVFWRAAAAVGSVAVVSSLLAISGAYFPIHVPNAQIFLDYHSSMLSLILPA